ncbi:VOC family protein [Undibacterium sp. LX40W]|uniref:VOC family protein n=1 Tax=Undibacterium nitidum TaxID=2762298 RepID=A0A923HVA9_9BURK|nr:MULTISPECIES: VOC family protein [Undibacterium]MBC3881979.1 VOC family protein [Undibacterium nitidum]MBC3892025.1 VOC family protein [Undibacterium sp. LX40W]
MRHPNFILLYVDQPIQSAQFYQDLLASAPIEASPGFAMFSLDSGVMLGLWAREHVLPSATGHAGATEIAISLTSKSEVDVLYQDYLAKSIEIAQTPTDLDFGYTFVALDPDGHRIRVFAPHV